MHHRQCAVSMHLSRHYACKAACTLRKRGVHFLNWPFVPPNVNLDRKDSRSSGKKRDFGLVFPVLLFQSVSGQESCYAQRRTVPYASPLPGGKLRFEQANDHIRFFIPAAGQQVCQT